jgi:surfeit locus 1 family protein
MTARPGGWLVWLGAVLALAATTRLGLWQLDRAAQKTAVHAAWSERTQLPPLPAGELARDAAAVASQLHRRIVLQGHWSREHTLFLDNRTRDGVAGFVVVTPLVIGQGDAVLVQRGWVPRDPHDRTRVPAVASPAGPVTIEGRIAPWPPARLALSSVEEGPIRQNLDPAQLAREAKVALRPLSLLQLSDGDALRHDWPEPPTDVAMHHGYALQWFAMSALIVGLALWHGFIRPRRGQRD